jgi:rubredoxin
MGEQLICPNCKDTKNGFGDLRWIDVDQEDLLETGIMKCQKCQAEYKGIRGWMKAMGLKQEY